MDDLGFFFGVLLIAAVVIGLPVGIMAAVTTERSTIIECMTKGEVKLAGVTYACVLKPKA